MLKAKRILNDLKHNLKGTKRVFNYYDVEHNELESKNLSISSLDIVRALQPYEIDFKKEYGYDFDDVVYNYDTLELLDDLDNIQLKHGYYIDLNNLNFDANNSYNWSSQVVFDFGKVKLYTSNEYAYEPEYIAIKFHRYGDVRGNYTDYMVLDMSIDEFYEVIMEATRVYTSVKIKNVNYEVSTDCFKEGCLFDIYSNNNDDYDVYLDIDNLRSKASIKKALREYLKENAA